MIIACWREKRYLFCLGTAIHPAVWDPVYMYCPRFGDRYVKQAVFICMFLFLTLTISLHINPFRSSHFYFYLGLCLLFPSSFKPCMLMSVLVKCAALDGQGPMLLHLRLLLASLMKSCAALELAACHDWLWCCIFSYWNSSGFIVNAITQCGTFFVQMAAIISLLIGSS